MFLLVTVTTVTDTRLDILMSESHYNAVKDWMFEASGLRVVDAVKASDKGVKL